MTSLKVRLGLLALLGLASVLLIQGGVLHFIPRLTVEAYVLSRLEHDADTLYVRLVDRDNLPTTVALSLGIIYDTPLSGHYFRVARVDTVLRSRSLWDEDLPAVSLEPGEVQVNHVLGPINQMLMVFSRAYRVNGQTLVISVAEDISLMRQAIGQLERGLLLLTVAVFAFVLLLQVLILRRAFLPLDLAVQACQRLEAGHTAPLTAIPAPQEITPILEAINRLIQHHGLRLARSRRALGNVGHALKTPLAVLYQSVDELRVQGHHDMAVTMQQQLDSMGHTLQRELHRAQLAGAGLIGSGFNVQTELTALTTALSRLYAHQVHINLDITGGTLPLDADDMLELFGNLMDNACKWAKTQVRVEVCRNAGLEAVIEDDGPGVPVDQLQRLGAPGLRLDEQTPGTGLGLAIVTDIVTQYHGDIEFAPSPGLGGLRVRVSIPLDYCRFQSLRSGG